MQRVVARADYVSRAVPYWLRAPLKERGKVKYAVAITDYDEGRYRVAIDQLNAVAFEYPAPKRAMKLFISF